MKCAGLVPRYSIFNPGFVAFVLHQKFSTFTSFRSLHSTFFVFHTYTLCSLIVREFPHQISSRFNPLLIPFTSSYIYTLYYCHCSEKILNFNIKRFQNSKPSFNLVYFFTNLIEIFINIQETSKNKTAKDNS